MEKKGIVLVFSTLVVIASCDYNYYQVTLQWQPATCSDANLQTPCVNTPQDRFSIHGVWPTLSSGSYPQCPGTPAYDGSKISTIRNRLNADWPSVIYGTNPTLWSHEWTTHGTCSYPSLSQLDYFTFGLDTYAKYDIYSALDKEDIYPSEDVYSKSSINNAIRKITQKLPGLRCNTNDYSRERQLHEIILCFAKSNRAIIDCPSNVVTCGNYVYWYPWYPEGVKKQ
ncbi:ribonuclease MC-like [Momordica charantia]|uniref:Ribonuclease MC-like n=1 Tax=Momordica charantia TaxID=3673 RepID=A0A6J1E266_MOMCH|nr:ribonuclease MC-like [Momordica charantia]